MKHCFSISSNPAHGKPGRPRKDEEKRAIGTLKSRGSNQSAYPTASIGRDNPEILERMNKGDAPDAPLHASNIRVTIVWR